MGKMDCLIPFLRLYHRKKQHKRQKENSFLKQYLSQGLIRKRNHFKNLHQKEFDTGNWLHSHEIEDSKRFSNSRKPLPLLRERQKEMVLLELKF